MRVLGDVPEIGENAVTAVFGVREIFLAQCADETGFAELRGAIALAVTVGRRHEQELLPGDEVAHQRGQKAQDLAAVKALGTLFGSVFHLQRVLPVGARQEGRFFQPCRISRVFMWPPVVDMRAGSIFRCVRVSWRRVLAFLRRLHESEALAR
jgi:hypothetical protein